MDLINFDHEARDFYWLVKVSSIQFMLFLILMGILPSSFFVDMQGRGQVSKIGHVSYGEVNPTK